MKPELNETSMWQELDALTRRLDLSTAELEGLAKRLGVPLDDVLAAAREVQPRTIGGRIALVAHLVARRRSA